MSSSAKASKTSTTAAATKAPKKKEAEPVKAAEPPAPAVASKKTKAPAAQSAPAVVAPSQAAASAPETTENEVVAPAEASSPIVDLFSKFNKNLQELQAGLAHARAEVKTLEKQVLREVRALEKQNNRKNRKNSNRQPSGFVKPTKISDELADFLGRDRGSLMARTEVTKLITQYVRDNQLQDKLNGRFILADDKLKALLNYDEAKANGDKLSYFNLQRYLRGHFTKA
jgi:chromatin remodeling complex protein RSC6